MFCNYQVFMANFYIQCIISQYWASMLGLGCFVVVSCVVDIDMPQRMRAHQTYGRSLSLCLVYLCPACMNVTLVLQLSACSWGLQTIYAIQCRSRTLHWWHLFYLLQDHVCVVPLPQSLHWLG